MAELPPDWGLKKRKRVDGRVDVVGKAADGSEYVPCTTERDELTHADVDALAAGDHERITPREFTSRFIANKAQRDAEYEQQMLEDYTEGVEQVMRGAYASGTANGPSFNCSSPRVGFSNIAQWRWDRAFGPKEQ